MKIIYLRLKKLGFAFICLIIAFSTLPFTACNLISRVSSSKVEEFYETVVQSQELLDIVADDIYQNWYDYVYEDEYSTVNSAIYYAQLENEENLKTIEENEVLIRDLYKEVKESKFEYEVKEVMAAYSDYYEFVVNVSGSFETYKQGKEEYKKALASALKKLSLEL